jgi:predicted transposase/invertase (TIGR01784 family)
MKTDGLFYSIFLTLPTAFFDTLGLPPETADLYTFDSVEVKALSFRIDGVFLPQNAEVPMYFVEVQFQKDVGFYSRFLTEIFMYLDKAPLPNDWRGVVIYPRRSLDPADEPQNARYKEILESSRVQRFYLNEMGAAAQQLPGVGLMCLAVEPEIGSRAREVLAQARSQGGQFYDQVLELVEKTLMQRFPNLSQEELLTMMDIKLNDWKNSRVYREVKAEVEEVAELRGKMEAARNFLRLGVAPEIVAQAVEMSLEEVQQLQQAQP